MCYEAELTSTEDAARNNFLKRAVITIARVRGIALTSANKINAMTWHNEHLPLGAPEGAFDLPPVCAMLLEALRRTAAEQGCKFGEETLIPFDGRKFRSLRNYHRLLGVAATGQWRWREFGRTSGAPMWQRSIGIA
jgi:hypothetical protein